MLAFAVNSAWGGNLWLNLYSRSAIVGTHAPFTMMVICSSSSKSYTLQRSEGKSKRISPIKGSHIVYQLFPRMRNRILNPWACIESVHVTLSEPPCGIWRLHLLSDCLVSVYLKWGFGIGSLLIWCPLLFCFLSLIHSSCLRLSRSPPRPSPGSLHYSDEDVSTKYNDLIPAESSSLTEKPSEISDSQVLHALTLARSPRLLHFLEQTMNLNWKAKLLNVWSCFFKVTALSFSAKW